MATATVSEPSVLVRIPADQMRSKMIQADPFLLAVIRILMDNLREANSYYARWRDPVDLDEHLGVLWSVLGSLQDLEDATRDDVAEVPTKIGQCIAILGEVVRAMERHADRSKGEGETPEP